MNRAWSAKSLAGRFQHGVFYALIRVCGVRAAYLLLFPVVFWYACLPAVRRRAMPYLARRFPAAGTIGLSIHCFRLYFTFGLTLVDRAASGILGRFTIETPEEDAHALQGLFAENKGLILLASHTGCWQQALPELGGLLSHKVYTVMHRDPEDHDRRIHEHQGRAAAYTPIDPGEGPLAVFAMIRALQEGSILAITGDRLFYESEPFVEVPLLGASVRLPYAPFRLAAASGAPLAVAFARRTGSCRGRLYLDSVIRVPEKTGKRAEAYRAYAEQYAARLEHYIMEYPYQFFNFFNLWEHNGYQSKTQTGAGCGTPT